MNISPKTKDAYQLLHEGTIALSEIEASGIRIDLEYCGREKKRLNRRIDRLEESLDQYQEVKDWKKKYGAKFKLGSDEQLSWLLFDHLKLPSTKLTESGEGSTDRSVLDKLDRPFAKDLVQHRQLCKARDTYLDGIVRESVNGFIHPFFNLNTVRTFRSSSSNPNFQNVPVRIEEIKKIVRSAFIPRPGNRFGGIDYGGIEVKVAACYHRDPNMLKYINDPGSDLHRDIAMDLFLLSIDEVEKKSRFRAKNGFTFAQFYGDWWKSCAENIWESIDLEDIKTKKGIPLKEHLWDKGIKGLGTLNTKGSPSKGSFYEHVKDVENIFWNERFPIYTKWKKEWIKRYERLGYFDMFTGFRCSGIMGKNDVINYPVQGAAFHCLLWSLVRLHKWMKKEKLRSKIVGQIHDEIVSDTHPDELEIYLIMAQEIMCRDIKKHWDWIITPLSIDAEFSPVDKSWYDIEDVKLPVLTEKVLF